jgi:hypothetical protein
MIKIAGYFLLILCLVSCKKSLDKPAELPITKESNSLPVELFSLQTASKSLTPYLLATDNGVFVSWQETENDTLFKLQYAKLIGDSFFAPETITQGKNWFVNWADYPVISENINHFLAHTLQKSATGTYTYDVMLNRKVKDSSWSKSFKLHSDTIQAEHGFVSMLPLPEHEFFATWLDGRHTVNVSEGKRAMTIRGAFINAKGNVYNSVSLDDKVCDCCQTTAALTPNGPVVIYRDRSDAEVRDMSIVRFVNGTWTKPKSLYNDNWKIEGCPVNGPRAASKENTLVIAWFAAPNEVSRVNVIFSEDSDKSFLAPIKVDLGNPNGRVDIDLINEQTAIVSWLEDASIFARLVSKDGSMGKVVTISDTSEKRSSGFPQLEIYKDHVFVAWTKVVENKGSHIQVGRIPIKEFQH